MVLPVNFKRKTMTHPFSASIKNREMRNIVSKILSKNGENEINSLLLKIDDLITESLGYLAGKEYINNEEVLQSLLCVLLYKISSKIEPIKKSSEKRSPLFFWEIKSILPDKL